MKKCNLRMEDALHARAGACVCGRARDGFLDFFKIGRPCIYVHFFCLPKRNEAKKRAPRSPNKSLAFAALAYSACRLPFISHAAWGAFALCVWIFLFFGLNIMRGCFYFDHIFPFSTRPGFFLFSFLFLSDRFVFFYCFYCSGWVMDFFWVMVKLFFWRGCKREKINLNFLLK